MNDKSFTKEQLAALKRGDEVALWYGGCTVNNHRDPQFVSDLLAALVPLRERLEGKP